MDIVNFIHELIGPWFSVLMPLWVIVFLVLLRRWIGLTLTKKEKFLLFYTTSLFSTFNFSWNKGANLNIGFSGYTDTMFMYIILIAPFLSLFTNYIYKLSLKRFT